MDIKIVRWFQPDSGYYGLLKYRRGRNFYTISYFKNKPPLYALNSRYVKRGKIPPTYLKNFTATAKCLGWLKRRKPV